MNSPRVTDNKSTVEVDVHGLFVDDAIDVILRLVRLASERGRVSVRVIHGSSTSALTHTNRTIKHELVRHLEHGMDGVSGHFQFEDSTLISLMPSTSRDSTVITLFDLR